MKIMKKQIHVEHAGTLKQMITEYEKDHVTHLKISGALNSKDFDVLDDMCTVWSEYDENDNPVINEDRPPFLKDLDLGDCILVDKPYLNDFTYHSRLERFVCPKNLEGINDSMGFEDEAHLKTVVIPENFKEFGNATFFNCNKLVHINFPDSLEKIGSFSFSGTALKKVNIPAKVSSIDCAAFGGCDALEKFDTDPSNPYFTVLDGVLFTKDKKKLVAFPCGNKTKHYTIPEGVEIIGEGSFLDAQIESIVFPSTLKTIEGWAFRFCENLKRIDIPDSVTEIGEVAFEFCLALNKVKLPDKLTILKQQAFGGGDNLKEIDVPASVKVIEEYALGWSDSLETIHLHDGLEVLDDLTQIKTLKHVVIPKTVKKIASGIFRKCSNMQEIEIDPENPYFCTVDGLLYSNDKTVLIAVPFNENKKITIPEGVEIIRDFVFEGFKNLEEIVLPESLKEIGHRAFDGCSSLKKVTFPKSLKSIDFRAFDNCTNLQVIEMMALKPPKITNPSSGNWKFFGYAGNVILYVPEASLESYQKASGWRDIKNQSKLNQIH
jgi:hypothetical protein